jgi:hypothetical protein
MNQIPNLSYKNLMIVDGDNVMDRIGDIMNKISGLKTLHFLIFVSANFSKSKSIKEFQKNDGITIVETEIDGANNVDLAISLFCGAITNFDRFINLAIITFDHFGPNLVRLLHQLNIKSVFLLPHELENKTSESSLEKLFNPSQHSLQTLWRGKWLQGLDRFSDLYHLDRGQFRKWFEQRIPDLEIEQKVFDFIQGKKLSKPQVLTTIEFTDDELVSYYKTHWKGTQGEFCRIFGNINPNNFSRWLSGKNPKSDASRNAVLAYITQNEKH